MKKYNYIYKITNLVNGKIYIGKHSTDNLDDNYMGSGVYLKNAKIKYGIENFTKDYLAFCDTDDKLNWFEKYYIKKYHTRDLTIGYNLTDGGDGGAGHVITQEGLKNISESHKGNTYWLGKKHKEVSKEKIGIKQSGQNNSFYGKQHTDETKEKISIAVKEAKEKRRAAGIHNKLTKYKWRTPDGDIKEMDSRNAKVHHPDWIKIEDI